MKYAVVIPCFNEERNLERCLRSIGAALDGRDVQLRVADNGSKDNCRQIALAANAEFVCSKERISIAELRNFGASGLDAEIIVFLDADMEVPSDWFDQMDKAFDVDGVDALGYVETIPEDAPWYARAWSLRTAARRDKARPTDFLQGRNIAVRRHVFERVGGFNGQLRTSEDKDFVLRLKRSGAKVYTYPQINLLHWGYEKSVYELLRKEFWRQGSHVSMLRRHGISIRLLRFPALAVFHLLAWLLLPFALLASEPLLAMPFLLSWVPSLVLVLAKPVSRNSLSLMLQLLVLYHLRFVVAGMSVIYEYTTGKRAIDYVRS